MLESLPDRGLPESTIADLEDEPPIELTQTLLTTTAAWQGGQLVESFLIQIDGTAHVLTYYDGDEWTKAGTFDATGMDEAERVDRAWEIMPEPPTVRAYVDPSEWSELL